MGSPFLFAVPWKKAKRTALRAQTHRLFSISIRKTHRKTNLRKKDHKRSLTVFGHIFFLIYCFILLNELNLTQESFDRMEQTQWKSWNRNEMIHAISLLTFIILVFYHRHVNLNRMKWKCIWAVLQWQHDNWSDQVWWTDKMWISWIQLNMLDNFMTAEFHSSSHFY